MATNSKWALKKEGYRWQARMHQIGVMLLLITTDTIVLVRETLSKNHKNSSSSSGCYILCETSLSFPNCTHQGEHKWAHLEWALYNKNQM